MGMDTSNINLSDCSMHSSQGPAVDMSGASKLCMNQGSITQCVGKVYRGCPAVLLVTALLFTHQRYIHRQHSMLCRRGLDVGR